MLRALTLLAAIAPLCALRLSSSPASEERAAVEREVQDYVEALYEVKPEWIDRGVDPGLEKLGFYRRGDAPEFLPAGKMTFTQLRDLAARWNQDHSQGTDLKYEIQVLDVSDVTASAKLTATWGIDYMHLVKADGHWKTVQILWQSHPPRR